MHPKAIQSGLLAAGWKPIEYAEETGRSFPQGSVCLRNGLRQNESSSGFMVQSSYESVSDKNDPSLEQNESSTLEKEHTTDKNGPSWEKNESSILENEYTTDKNGPSREKYESSTPKKEHSIDKNGPSIEKYDSSTVRQEHSINKNEQSTLQKEHSTHNDNQSINYSCDKNKNELIPTMCSNRMKTADSANEVKIKEGDAASARMEELMTGQEVDGDSGCSTDIKPEWLDMEKFKKGREFFQKYFFSVFFTDVVSILLVFSLPHILRPLIYTKKSETVWKAFKRYVSTVLHVKLWYEDDVWNSSSKSHKSIRAVRNVHGRMSKLINSENVKNAVDNITVRGYYAGELQPKCPMISVLKSDLCTGSACPMLAMNTKQKEALYISQTDMSLTQFGFVGMLLLYPEKFGAPYVTQKEMESHIHFWRGCGYLLGIDDKYNFCKGSYEETLQVARKIVTDIIKPHLKAISEDFEHMSRVLVESLNTFVPGVTFESVLLYIGWVIGLELPTLYSRITWHQWCCYWFLRFLFGILLWIPGALWVFNWLLRGVLVLMTNPPEWWKKYGYKLPIAKVNYI